MYECMFYDFEPDDKTQKQNEQCKADVFTGTDDKNAGFMRISTSKMKDKMKKIDNVKDLTFRDFISFFKILLISFAASSSRGLVYSGYQTVISSDKNSEVLVLSENSS